MKFAWQQILSNWPSVALVLIACIFTAGFSWAAISTHEKRIAALETDDLKRSKTLTRMDYNIQIIARKVGVEPLKPTYEEKDDE